MTRFDCNGISADPLGSSGQLAAAADFFIREGYVVLDHVLPRDTVEALHRAFLSDYAAFVRDAATAGPALTVSGKRHMISLRFAGVFADPLVFANPAVVAVVHQVLEATAILEAYGCILSMPGAPAQHEHHDGPHLFGSALSAMLPPYALTFALPLVEMNETQGSTMLVPGSHRWQARRDDAATLLPVVPPGSCVLWDYRLRHYGTENRSPAPRPLLYGTYARPWYRDPVNFRETPELERLDLPPGFVESLPEPARRLLGHATATGATGAPGRRA
ncbi:MAG: phytanoyl-CoA dioxygenase family protein [Proteobacteria bacterium]|nr:phytanoyl-CoA dioxygenase family protein [Pseudomonadota bacterium]